MRKKETSSQTGCGEMQGPQVEYHAIAEALMNVPNEYVAILNRNGRILAANKAVCRRSGKTPELLSGCEARDLFERGRAELWMSQFESACRKTELVRYEDEIEGSFFDHMIYPIIDSSGMVSKILSISRDITAAKKAEQALRRSEERYRLVTERTSDMVSILTFALEPIFAYVSPAHKSVLGYEPGEMLGKPAFDFIHPEDKEKLVPPLAGYLASKADGSLKIQSNGPTERLIFRIRDSNGNWRFLESTGDFLEAGYILFVSRDVTERIKAEDGLKKYRDELELKVEERTRALQAKSENLEEANAALKVLLDIREKDRMEIERKLLSNLRHLAEPYIAKLKNSHLDERQRSYLEILESSLSDIISPLLRNLAARERTLTPSELQISDLIRFGKRTKEIAETLGMSQRTVEGHRRKIRKKLGLDKKSSDLRSYLLERET